MVNVEKNKYFFLKNNTIKLINNLKRLSQYIFQLLFRENLDTIP